MTVDRKVVLVTRRTRLEELVRRFHTTDQARFYVEHLGESFSDYEQEHAAYLNSKATIIAALEAHGRWQAIERYYLPNFLFGPDDVVLALGQDGLVANTMKYLTGHPLIGINPEPQRYDGILLPFTAPEIAKLLPDVLANKRPAKTVTMAEATLPDGQQMLAVNDLFVGPKSHTSARYTLTWHGQRESQSSSGLIVSTGLGSTGWMSSVVIGSEGIHAAWSRQKVTRDYTPLPWDAQTLRFAVREPFRSHTTGVTLVYGEIGTEAPLKVTSHMPEGGVIFSDGIEADCLSFGAGLTVTIKPAERHGLLIA